METLREQLIDAMYRANTQNGIVYRRETFGGAADDVLRIITPQPGEQLYKKCLVCDGCGRVRGIPPEPAPRTNSVLESRDIMRCESCDGRGVVPTIVPSPDDGIAGVLEACRANGLDGGVAWDTVIGDAPSYRAWVWKPTGGAIAEVNADDPLTALRSALARVGSAADAEGG